MFILRNNGKGIWFFSHPGPTVQDLIDGQAVDHDADQGGDDVGDGLRPEDELGLQEHRQQEEGHKVHRLAEGGQGEGVGHQAHGGEAVHDHVLHPQGDDGQGADLDGPQGQIAHGGVGGEEADEVLPRHPGQNKE